MLRLKYLLCIMRDCILGVYLIYMLYAPVKVFITLWCH